MILKKIPLFGLLSLSLLSSSWASTVDSTLVKKVENYLNGIKSYRATIAQKDDRGTERTGHMYMLRDGLKAFGKMRIEYDPPLPDLVVADGSDLITIYDAASKEKNAYDIDATPAAFLLRNKIDLQNDLRVVDQKVQEDGTTSFKVVRGNDTSGALTLQFSTHPLLKLNGWSITDPQGIVTDVQLSDVNIGIDLDPNLFIFKDK